MCRLLLTLTCLTLFLANDLDKCNCDSMTDVISRSFVRSLLKNYGRNGTLTYQGLYSFLRGEDPVVKTSTNNGANNTCVTKTSHINFTELEVESCNVLECHTLKDISVLHSIPTSTLNVASLQQMAPVILYLLKHNCTNSELSNEKTGKKDHLPPSQVSVWGYGFLMVTVINLCSLVGVMVLPFMKMAAYRQILIFMVALAVGALAGSGLLCLIPEAFGLVNEDSGNLDYIFKASMVMCGIYIFYLTEKMMRMVTKWKERRNLQRHKNHSDLDCRDEDENQKVMEIICSVKKNPPVNQDIMYKEARTLPSSVSCTHQELMEKSSDESTICKDKMSDFKDSPIETYENTSSAESTSDTQHIIKPLAWMIIFGDGLHNFIDGLSIGTAFTQSSLAGLSVSVAVMCEELPHELGDFAILLNCGMSVKKALLYNFLSACMCYIGLIIGILLGEYTASHDWIFAIAGGMFLYISLAEMVPEMNSASEVKGSRRTKHIFLIQNLGLLSGFGIMFILAIFGRYINFE